jgi:hypothetical protein
MWIGNTYLYSKSWLRLISDNYGNIYDCIKTSKADKRFDPIYLKWYELDVSRILVSDMESLVEYKVDFDTARKAAGKDYRKMTAYLNGEV